MPTEQSTGGGGGLPVIRSSRNPASSKKDTLPNWGAIYNPQYNPPALPSADGTIAGKRPGTPKSGGRPANELSKDTVAQAIDRLAQWTYDRAFTNSAQRVKNEYAGQGGSSGGVPRSREEGRTQPDFMTDKALHSVLRTRYDQNNTAAGMSDQAWFNLAANYTGPAVRWARAAEDAGDVDAWKMYMPTKMSSEMARTIFLADKTLQSVFSAVGGWYGFWNRYYTADGIRRDLATPSTGDGGGGDGGGGGRGRGGGGGAGGLGAFGNLNPYGPYVWRW